MHVVFIEWFNNDCMIFFTAFIICVRKLTDDCFVVSVSTKHTNKLCIFRITLRFVILFKYLNGFFKRKMKVYDSVD